MGSAGLTKTRGCLFGAARRNIGTEEKVRCQLVTVKVRPVDKRRDSAPAQSVSVRVLSRTVVMNKFLLVALVAVFVLVLVSQEASADKHKIIKKIVLKKVFKTLKKAKFIPIVVPFHLSKHQNQGWDQGGWDQGGHEKYHVQEIGGGHGGGGWEGGW